MSNPIIRGIAERVDVDKPLPCITAIKSQDGRSYCGIKMEYEGELSDSFDVSPENHDEFMKWWKQAAAWKDIVWSKID